MLFAASKFESEQIEFYGTNKLEFADMQIQINGDKAKKRCRQKQRICIYGHWNRAAHRHFLKWRKKDINDDEAQLPRFDEITA